MSQILIIYRSTNDAAIGKITSEKSHPLIKLILLSFNNLYFRQVNPIANKMYVEGIHPYGL